jgi:hypothetical protein
MLGCGRLKVDSISDMNRPLKQQVKTKLERHRSMQPQTLWSRDIDRHRLAVAKVILVPSDNETVASASCREYVALPGVAPLMVVPAGLADGSLETPENGRANNATRSITGGPGHDVIVEPATRPGPESMNSTSVMGRSCPASLALLIFRITHSMAWRVPASCR